jgi:hypothetical protein
VPLDCDRDWHYLGCMRGEPRRGVGFVLAIVMLV